MATGIEGTTDGSDCVEDVRAFYKKQIAELERQLSDLRAALEGKWISVDERLPELTESTPDVRYSQRVIVDTGILVLVADLNRWHDEPLQWIRDSGEALDRVLRWQPLPPAPKEA